MGQRAKAFIRFLGFFSIAMLGARLAYALPDPVLGFWYTENREGGVELYKCEDKICGRFRWLNPKPGEEAPRDINNPFKALRKEPLCHMKFMNDFTPDGQGQYKGGTIYSPRHGQDFSAEMTLINHDTLDLHGYILTPILGESQTWIRAKTMPDCEMPRD